LRGERQREMRRLAAQDAEMYLRSNVADVYSGDAVVLFMAVY